MIGSPWNPFFDQVIPGTSTRYDGRRVDNVDAKQSGGFNAIRLPHHVEVIDNTGTSVAILTRNYQMQGPSVPIETEVVLFGALYDTLLAKSIRESGFMWWWRPSTAFNNQYPRCVYISDADSDGFRYWLGAGFAHTGINFPEDIKTPPPTDYTDVWSLWWTDDIPVAEGGNPTFWASVPGTTVFEPGEDPKTYPLWIAEGGFDADIPAGSRIYSAIDLNRRSQLINVTTSETNAPITVRPWYREG